jgi:hypothetical protein
VSKDQVVCTINESGHKVWRVVKEEVVEHKTGITVGACAGVVTTGVLGVVGAAVGTQLALVGAGCVVGGAVVGYTVSSILK